MTPERLVAHLPIGDERSRYVVETVLRGGAGLPLDVREHASSDIRFVYGEGSSEWRMAAANLSWSECVGPLLDRHAPAAVDEVDLLDPIHAGTARLVASALFHVLAGTEEIESPERDRHARFAARTSRLFAAGYDRVPFVDVWGEAIVRAIRGRWPQTVPQTATPRLSVSHDVDAPYRYAFQRPLSLLKGMTRDALERRWGRMAQAPLSWARSRSGHVDQDPFNHFAWMMDQAEDVGARCTFYVIAGHSGGRIDGDYDIHHPVMMRLWESMLDRGHRIGVHPSYESFRSLDTLRQERDRVIDLHARLGHKESCPPVRMHYLRFDPSITPGLLAKAGFTRDSTLGFADRSGFRRGTCRPFRLWDHQADRPLDLVEHPLLAMDATLVSRRYEHLDQQGVERRIGELATQCRRFGGELTLLWHNNYYDRPWHFAAYQAALRSLSTPADDRKALELHA